MMRSVCAESRWVIIESVVNDEIDARSPSNVVVVVIAAVAVVVVVVIVAVVVNEIDA